MNTEPDVLFRLNSRIRHRKVGDEGVVVCMHSGVILVVNEVGAHILEQLRRPQNFANILDSVQNSFDVDETRARLDTKRYLTELGEQQVLVSKSVEIDAAAVAHKNV